MDIFKSQKGKEKLAMEKESYVIHLYLNFISRAFASHVTTISQKNHIVPLKNHRLGLSRCNAKELHKCRRGALRLFLNRPPRPSVRLHVHLGAGGPRPSWRAKSRRNGDNDDYDDDNNNNVSIISLVRLA